MRKWCAVVAIGALCALPLFAQQKDENATKPATDAASETSASPESSAPVTRGIFALPAVPKATPFPGPQAATKTMKDSRTPGQLVPK